MNGGEAIVKALEDREVGVVFGIPGVHDLPVYDALYESRSVRHVLARHEQGAAYMADGYARASGTTGVALVAAGPGALNALAAVSSAYLDSQPLLVLAGGITTSSWGKGAIHEFDQASMFPHVTKLSSRPRSAAALYRAVSDAHALASSGRPRPVFVELPFDYQVAESGPGSPRRREQRLRASARSISEAASRISASSKVAIIAGGGAVSANAWKDVRELASTLGAPVATTILGKGVVDERGPLSAGWLLSEPGRTCVEGADLVLALGCRFSERSTAAWSIRVPNLIHVDTDREELNRNYRSVLTVHADVKDFTARLLSHLKAGRARRAKPWFRRPPQERVPEHAISSTGALSPRKTMAEVVDAVPERAVMVVDTGYAFWNSITTRVVREPRRYLCSAGNAAMGYALPASIGAKLAEPGEDVVAVVGDGSLMMSGEELSVATEMKLDLTVVVLNDGGYGSIRDYQRTGYGGRQIGVDFKSPDYVGFAESCGASGLVARRKGEAAEAVKRSISKGGVTLIDVRLDGREGVLPSFLTGKYGKK